MYHVVIARRTEHAGRTSCTTASARNATSTPASGATSTLAPAHRGPDAPSVLRVPVGPLVWEVCDATAYTSLLRAWRQAARLLGDNPTDEEDTL